MNGIPFLSAALGSGESKDALAQLRAIFPWAAAAVYALIVVYMVAAIRRGRKELGDIPPSTHRAARPRGGPRPV